MAISPTSYEDLSLDNFNKSSSLEVSPANAMEGKRREKVTTATMTSLDNLAIILSAFHAYNKLHFG